ncbi:hypothetical protein ACFLYB_04935 [Chloroflexota bacterium]
MTVKLDNRVRVIRGNHIGRIGIVKSKDHSVVGVYPNQTYTKTLKIMIKNGIILSVRTDEVELIAC